MAKKKLFGNRKEPRCETCAHGKLTADKTTVLCQRGGALPLTHSCRRYQYDPLRRTPKRRPLLGEYSAADFALDAYQDETIETAVNNDVAPAISEHQTLDQVFEYLNSHDTPDVNALLAILNKNKSAPETVTKDVAETAPETVVEDAVEAALETAIEGIAETAPETVAEDVAETAPETVAEDVAETAPETVAEDVAETAPETVAEDVAETAPETVAEDVVEAAPETVAEDVAETAPETVAEDVAETAPETVAEDVAETAPETVAEDVAETAPETVAEESMQPDDSPDIFGDLNRLTSADTSRYAFGFDDLKAEHERDFLLLSHYPVEDVLLVAANGDANDAPLHIDDLVILSAAELADD